MKRSNLLLIPFLLFLVFCSHLAYSKVPFSLIKEKDKKEWALQSIDTFLNQFKSNEFSGQFSLIPKYQFESAFDQNLKVLQDPTLNKPGVYRQYKARVNPFTQYFTFDKSDHLVVNPNNTNESIPGITVWHESIHHLIHRKFDELPCGQEETYLELLEMRVDWLTKIRSFDKDYKKVKNAQTQEGIKRLKKKWKIYELDWNNYNRKWSGVPQNLSGKNFQWQDTGDASCGEANKVYSINYDFVQKLDSALGMDVDINKIRTAYADLLDKPERMLPQGILMETLTITNEEPVKIKSSNILEDGVWYYIEASGVISDWKDKNDGVDPVWCYAEWRCGKSGEVWDQLRIDGDGMTKVAGEEIPYNGSHTYKVLYKGQGRPIELYMSDAQGSWSDNQGSITVKLFK